MRKTTALGTIYLLMLFAFAAGIESLSRDDCSDWLANCPGEQAAFRRTSDKAAATETPGENEQR